MEPDLGPLIHLFANIKQIRDRVTPSFLQNFLHEPSLADFIYDDDEKCELINKNFGLFILKLVDGNVPLPEIV